ncbi:hypothetical protein NMY22_g18734 [Coprinellus aureogranulatus]|nr:hypothetical protein NMY22_g18734 [Coprinellus aureogranulatus]
MTANIEEGTGPEPTVIQSPPGKPPVLPWPDISNRAKWSVSSYKFGFGVECLRDGDMETFWQCVVLSCSG